MQTGQSRAGVATLRAGWRVVMLAAMPWAATAALGQETTEDPATLGQNEDLSPEARPGEVAFLRVVMPVGEAVRIDGQNLVPAPDSPASPYATVDDSPEIVVSDVRAGLSTPAGGHYSYLWGMGGTGVLVEDTMPADGTAGILRVYNLSSVPVDVWIAEAGEPAVAGLESMTSTSLPVVPGEVQAVLRAGDEEIGSIEGLAVEGGQGMSVAVWGDAGSLGYETFIDTYE